MHVGLIIDQERLLYEQSMLNRLCIGLMAEGLQLTRIVPDELGSETVDEGEQRIALAARIEAPMRVLPWLRQLRANRIADALDKSVPDIFYAVGEQAWTLGADLGEALTRPVLLDVCSLAQTRAAPKPAHLGRVQHGISGYIVPCRTLAEIMGRRIDPALVSVVPMGVAVPGEVRSVLDNPEQFIAVAVIGGSRDLPAYEAALGGLSMVGRDASNLHVFLELRGPHEHDIWLRAEKTNLVGSISAVADASSYRSLLTRCDLLLMPERSGPPRSMMLEAMALGMPVIAADNPILEMLVDQETAILVKRVEAGLWADSVRSLIADPQQSRRLGRNGRQMVMKGYRSSDQVAELITTLDRALSGGSLRLVSSRP